MEDCTQGHFIHSLTHSLTHSLAAVSIKHIHSFHTLVLIHRTSLPLNTSISFHFNALALANNTPPPQSSNLPEAQCSKYHCTVYCIKPPHLTSHHITSPRLIYQTFLPPLPPPKMNVMQLSCPIPMLCMLHPSYRIASHSKPRRPPEKKKRKVLLISKAASTTTHTTTKPWRKPPTHVDYEAGPPCFGFGK